MTMPSINSYPESSIASYTYLKNGLVEYLTGRPNIILENIQN